MMSATWIPFLRFVYAVITTLLFCVFIIWGPVNEKNRDKHAALGCWYILLTPVMFWFWFAGYPDTHCDDVLSLPVFCYRFFFGNSFMGFVAGVYMILTWLPVLLSIVGLVRNDQ
ncbi:MAG: hypothetical protein ACOX6B_09225 [Thermoguttaceae bacterium]|jgi:hypothetical protein